MLPTEKAWPQACSLHSFTSMKGTPCRKAYISAEQVTRDRYHLVRGSPVDICQAASAVGLILQPFRCQQRGHIMLVRVALEMPACASAPSATTAPPLKTREDSCSPVSASPLQLTISQRGRLRPRLIVS